MLHQKCTTEENKAYGRDVDLSCSHRSSPDELYALHLAARAKGQQLRTFQFQYFAVPSTTRALNMPLALLLAVILKTWQRV